MMATTTATTVPVHRSSLSNVFYPSGHTRRGSRGSSSGSNPHGSPVLTVMEAQRAVAILKDMMDKLKFLGTITPDGMQVSCTQ